jgi:hypothetical protein
MEQAAVRSPAKLVEVRLGSSERDREIISEGDFSQRVEVPRKGELSSSNFLICLMSDAPLCEKTQIQVR